MLIEEVLVNTLSQIASTPQQFQVLCFQIYYFQEKMQADMSSGRATEIVTMIFDTCRVVPNKLEASIARRLK